MLVSNFLIVSGAPSIIVKARPPKNFGPETVDMQFIAEEKELTSDSRFKGSGSLRMCRCNFATKDQGPVESFKSSLHHRIADNIWCTGACARKPDLKYLGYEDET